MDHLITICYHHWMNLEQLKIFCTIVETGSFRAASLRAHRTQPALTKSIQALEISLACKLFKADTYRATLTPSGEKIYKKAIRLLKQADDFKLFSSILAQGKELSIRIAVDVLYPISLLASILKKLHQDYPHIECRIYSESLGGAEERLVNNEVDMAISGYPVSNTSLKTQHFLNIPMIATASVDFFERHKHSLSDPRFLHKAPQIILSDSSQYNYSSGIIDGAASLKVSDLAMKQKLIEEGFGWGRLPKQDVLEKIHQGKLIIIDYPHIEERNVNLSLVKLADNPLGPIGKDLWKRIKSTKP